jgi:hypothetical protein
MAGIFAKGYVLDAVLKCKDVHDTKGCHQVRERERTEALRRWVAEYSHLIRHGGQYDIQSDTDI